MVPPPTVTSPQSSQQVFKKTDQITTLLPKTFQWLPKLRTHYNHDCEGLVVLTVPVAPSFISLGLLLVQWLFRKAFADPPSRVALPFTPAHSDPALYPLTYLSLLFF